MSPYRRALRLEILVAYDAGESAASLYARYGVSTSSLASWRQLRDETGDVAPRAHGGGPPRLMTPAAFTLLVQLREQYPEASQGELADHLASAGYPVGASTVSRSLKAAGYVRHAVKSSAKAALSAPEKRSNVRRYRRAAPPPDTAGRRAYPSDVTDAEWELLEPQLPAAKHKCGRPPEHPRREMVNAVFYLLRSGCQWRMLPHDFPPWEAVYAYFSQSRDSGYWEELNHALRVQVRQAAGREETPSAVIIDSQSVKTTEKGGPVDMTGQSE